MQPMTCCVTCHCGLYSCTRSGESHDGLSLSNGTKAVAVSCQEKTRRGPKQLTKSLLVKLHLRKGDPVRVTTPPAPRGTRYDIDLDYPNSCAVREGTPSL